MKSHLTWRDGLLALAVVFVWGTNFVVIRLGLDVLPPLFFASLRFFFVLLPACLLLARPGSVGESRSDKKKRPDPEGPGLSFSFEKERSLDRFLQFLGGAERDLLGCLDLDGFAGRGIAAHTRTTLAHNQDTQAIETDAGTLLQMLGDQGDGVFNDAIGELLRQLMAAGRVVSSDAIKTRFFSLV